MEFKQSGDYIKATEWNELTAEAEKAKPNTQPATPSKRQSPALVQLCNATGAAVGEFAVYQVQRMFALDDNSTPTFPESIWRDGVTLDGYAVTDPTAPFAVSQQPLAAGVIGTGIVNGVTACKVDGVGDYAAPVAGQTYLQACECGPARVIYRNAGNGPQWAVVSLSQHTCGGGGAFGALVFACLDADLYPGGNVTGKTWQDGDALTVYAPPLLCSGEYIPACSMVYAAYRPQDGRYYAIVYGGTCNCSCGGSDASSGGGGGSSGGGSVYAKIWYEYECVQALPSDRTAVSMYAYMDDAGAAPVPGLALYADLGTFVDYPDAEAAINAYFQTNEAALIAWGAGLMTCGEGEGNLSAWGYDVPWGTKLLDHDYTNESSSGGG